MRFKPIDHPDFVKYGHPVDGIDFRELLEALGTATDQPEEGTIYEPGDERLEALPVARVLQDSVFGGMPIQIGYCNGSNQALNCLEYHRGCELNIAADDVVLLLAPKQSIRGGMLDTAEVEAFVLPAGHGVLLYETTLHYAPCNAPGAAGFRVAIVLPRGTNTDKPEFDSVGEEDRMLRARNKWLLAHPSAPEAAQGAYVGLTGDNICLPVHSKATI